MRLLERLFIPRPAQAPPLPEPGLVEAMREIDGTVCRYHLRIEPDGRGLAIANASASLRLTASGTVLALGILRGEDDETILRRLRKTFHDTPRRQAVRDLAALRERLDAMAQPTADYPVESLDETLYAAHGGRLSAPFRADVAMAPPDRLRAIASRLWRAGIPHMTLLVPPDAPPREVVQAVEHAEDIGLIAGVRALGTALVQGSFLDDLAAAGVDHIDVPYAAADIETHDALCGAGDHGAAETVLTRCHALEVCPVAEALLVDRTFDGLEETLARLASLHVPTVSVYAIAAPDERSEVERGGALSASGVAQAAAIVEEAAVSLDLRCLWQPPRMREPHRDLRDQIAEGPRCSGDVAIRVNADGAVIPPRGTYCEAGNLLTDDWPAIWSHAAFRVYRETLASPARCERCTGLATCAMACVRDTAGWASGTARELSAPKEANHA